MDLNRKNIVILTVGRCGSSVLVRMLEQLGWLIPGANEYAENDQFNLLNDQFMGRSHPCEEELTGFVNALPEPWILKDPRFVWTQQHWPMLRGNLLLWITRDLDAVEKSLRRQKWGRETDRGWTLRGYTVEETRAACEHVFNQWGGPRLRISYESLQRAVPLFTGPTG